MVQLAKVGFDHNPFRSISHLKCFFLFSVEYLPEHVLQLPFTVRNNNCAIIMAEGG